MFSQSGTVTTGTGGPRFPIPGATHILYVIATAATAPTGQALIFDVNKNGTTIFSTQANRPTIAVGTNQTTLTPTPDTTTVSAGDYLTVDIDQVGSGTAGADVVVMVVFG